MGALLALSGEQERSRRNRSLTMRTLICFLTLFTLTYASLHGLVKHEVEQLMRKDDTLTVDTCTDQCDALFGMASAANEDTSDQLCAQECDNALNPTTRDPNHHNHHNHHNSDAPTTVTMI